jgi:uncharacterized protein (TIGR03067 family)
MGHDTPNLSPTLEGTWEMVRAEHAGEAAPELVIRQTCLELTVTDYVVRFAGKISDQGIYSASPTTLMLVGTRGVNAGRTIRCIYQLVGDRLRICYGLDGSTPDGFTTSTGDKRYLATYRRAATR